MKYSTFASLALASSALAAYVPSDPWTDLTPSAPAPTGATTDHSHKFGIQIVTVSGSGSAASSAPATTTKDKRDAVNQIGDGQIQKQTSVSLTTPAPKSTAKVINQIGDGQIQHQTATTAKVINQIGDGQIQHQTATTAKVINQIGDGQIQHQTTTASVINQIGDGQIQHQTVSGASQITDGQVQAPTGTPGAEDDEGVPTACLTDNSLAMNLTGGILTDAKGRIGAIVANRQFQFDGPPPQAGSIYAAGWSITTDGNLALGDKDVFYQCLSGDFYNLYDENVATQCSAVHLSVIDLVAC